MKPKSFVTLRCEFCGADFVTTIWDQAKGRRFCNRQCYGLHRTMHAKQCPLQTAYRREMQRLNMQIARWQVQNSALREELGLQRSAG